MTKSVVTGVPLFELDRMILSSIRPRHWESVVIVIETVEQQCAGRNMDLSDQDIFQRILELIDEGVLAMCGDIVRWWLRQIAVHYPFDDG